MEECTNHLIFLDDNASSSPLNRSRGWFNQNMCVQEADTHFHTNHHLEQKKTVARILLINRAEKGVTMNKEKKRIHIKKAQKANNYQKRTIMVPRNQKPPQLPRKQSLRSNIRRVGLSYIKIQRYRLTVTAVMGNFKTDVTSTIFHIFLQYYTLR